MFLRDHVSWFFVGWDFLDLYLSGKIRGSYRKGHIYCCLSSTGHLLWCCPEYLTIGKMFLLEIWLPAVFSRSLILLKDGLYAYLWELEETRSYLSSACTHCKYTHCASHENMTNSAHIYWRSNIMVWDYGIQVCFIFLNFIRFCNQNWSKPGVSWSNYMRAWSSLKVILSNYWNEVSQNLCNQQGPEAP